jgi:hypothetical protein
MDHTEFKTLTEEAQASADRVHELLGGEKQEGFARRSNHSIEAIDATVDIFERAVAGENKGLYEFREASMLSDFPYLFGDVLDRSMMSYYQAWIPDWTSYIKFGRPLRDFRQAKRLGMIGLTDVLPAVGEREEYAERHPSEDTPITLQVGKFGTKWGVNFETLINDDLGALADMPQSLAIAARRTEALKVAQLFVDANGPNANVFKASSKNQINTTNGAASNNPPLTIDALGDAMLVMGKQVDAYGHPIVIEAATLVVPPALEIKARNILMNAYQIQVAQGGGAYTAQNQLVTTNWMAGRLSVQVNPYIPYVASTANGNSSWFVIANALGNRPFAEFSPLSGHIGPELFVKTPNSQRLGGGTVPEDFDQEAVWYKVRDIFGVAIVDPKLAVASNGSGS